MNLEDARLIGALLRQLADRLDLDLTPDAPPPPLYANPADLDRAIAAAAPGATLLLNSTLVYPSHLILDKPINLISPIGGSSFLDGVEVKGSGIGLNGLTVKRNNPLVEIVNVTGAGARLTNLTVLGDPVKGARRGIVANGADFSLTNSYVDNCFQAYPGNDSQALISWSSPGPFLIEGNRLFGGSETVMIGGSDPFSAELIPSDIVIRGNTISAHPEWQPLLIGVKSRLEIKNAKRLLIENNDISYCWGKHGQDGYLLTLNVRNQEGRAPFSTIEDVIVRNNTLSHGAAGINILGTDNRAGFPSQRMRNVAIYNNAFSDIDGVKYDGGTAKMILIMGGADDLSINDNTFAGSGLSSAFYFGSGLYTNLSIQGNTVPATKYLYFGNAVGTNLNLIKAAFVTSGTIANNLVGA